VTTTSAKVARSLTSDGMMAPIEQNRGLCPARADVHMTMCGTVYSGPESDLSQNPADNEGLSIGEFAVANASGA